MITILEWPIPQLFPAFKKDCFKSQTALFYFPVFGSLRAHENWGMYN